MKKANVIILGYVLLGIGLQLVSTAPLHPGPRFREMGRWRRWGPLSILSKKTLEMAVKAASFIVSCIPDSEELYRRPRSTIRFVQRPIARPLVRLRPINDYDDINADYNNVVLDDFEDDV